MEHDANAVLAGDDRARYVRPITAEAILGLQYEFIVDVDRGDRVDAFEVEIPSPVQIVGIDDDGALEHPVFPGDPLDIGLVSAAIGIGDDAGPLQRAVHVARQRDRQGVAVVGGGKQPIAGKVDTDGIAVRGLGRHFHGPFVHRAACTGAVSLMRTESRIPVRFATCQRRFSLSASKIDATPMSKERRTVLPGG